MCTQVPLSGLSQCEVDVDYISAGRLHRSSARYSNIVKDPYCCFPSMRMFQQGLLTGTAIRFRPSHNRHMIHIGRQALRHFGVVQDIVQDTGCCFLAMNPYRQGHHPGTALRSSPQCYRAEVYSWQRYRSLARPMILYRMPAAVLRLWTCITKRCAQVQLAGVDAIGV